jgi:SulP family sulfate permease
MAIDRIPGQIIDTLKPDWRLLWPRLVEERRTYSWQKLRADAFAAATVAMVSIPQAVGFALLAGLPPAMVLGSVVVGGFVAAFFFSCRHVIFGPSNSLSLLLAATFVARQDSALGPAEMAVLLALLIGAVQLAAGLLRFGQVTQYISRSVIIGYSAAIGVLLVFSQLHYLLGVESFKSNSLWSAPYHALLTAFSGELNPYSVGTCLAAFLIFTLIKRLRPRWPEALVGLMFFCLLDWWLDISALGVSSLGQSNAILASFPNFSGLPITTRELDTVRSLLVPTFALALLGMLEAVSISKSYSMKSGDVVDNNRELVAMGLGNIASACFASMPGSASFARSATSYQAGARTQLAGVISSVFVLGFVLLLTPLVNHLPVPALAAALIRVGWNLVDREQIRIAARSTRSDALALGTTFMAAMLMPLDIAIYIGVGVALFLALRKASAPTLVEYVFNDFGNLTQRETGSHREHNDIAIIHVEGEMFFGAADLFQNHVRQQVERENLRVVILRLKNARHLDATTVFALRGLQDYLKQTGRHLLISGVHGEVLRVLKNSGVLKHVGTDNIFPAELNPNLATKKALQRARELLPASEPNVRIFYDNPANLPKPA